MPTKHFFDFFREVHGKKAKPQTEENLNTDQDSKSHEDAENAAESSTETAFVCVHCKIPFSSDQLLQEHIREEHSLNRGGVREVCPYCLGFTTGYSIYLSRCLFLNYIVTKYYWGRFGRPKLEGRIFLPYSIHKAESIKKQEGRINHLCSHIQDLDKSFVK